MSTGSANICDKGCQKFVKIRVLSRSAMLSFCQIFMTITRVKGQLEGQTHD